MNEHLKAYTGTRRPLSPRKQLENCLLALWRWSEVRPASVKLHAWRCGSHACFGGHLATWPEFQAKGVYAEPDGTPRMEGVYGADADGYLFGDSSMFAARFGGSEGYDPAGAQRSDGRYKVSDHRLVVMRLEQRIVDLTEELAAT